MEIDRREFLRLLGVTTASGALAAWGASELLSVPEEVFERAVGGPRIETWKNTICSMCSAGCGIRVRLIDGIPVRITGNPIYPINRGGICPRAEAAVELLFHPKRVRGPLKRSGKRGENSWQEVSWDEAVATVAERLEKLRSGGEPEKLALLQGENNELLSSFMARFMAAFGSPNYFMLGRDTSATHPSLIAQGMEDAPAYDLANADFVLNFGADVLDEGPSPVRFNQLYADMRKRGAKVVHISSYMSRTAAQSSEWLRIEPGTAAAIALAVAHVMIKDGTYDSRFISRSTFGFYGWRDSDGTQHEGFKDLVLEEYYPRKAAEITGVPASEIVRTARRFAASKHAPAICGPQAASTTNGLYTLWAVYCLNALKGNFSQRGGVLFRGEMPVEFPVDAPLSRSASAGKPALGSKIPSLPLAGNSTVRFLEGLAEKDPYQVDTLLLHGAHRFFATTPESELARATKGVPFVVSLSSFLDESTHYADMVLPEHLFLERWEMSRSVPGVEFHHVGVQQPVIEPLYDTKHPGDLILELAGSVGGDVARALHWKDYGSFIRDQAKAIFDSGEGTIITESLDLSWMRFLKERGWRILEYSTFDEFWQLLLEKGGWWDPRDLTEVEIEKLPTQSGKFEFYSRLLRSEMEKKSSAWREDGAVSEELLGKLGVEARGDKVFLPHLEAPRFCGERAQYPYVLLLYPVLGNDSESGATLGLLQEMRGLYARKYWRPWVEMDPGTAARKGIEEGDYVRVVSQSGVLVAEAHIVPTVMPGTVAIPAFADPGKKNPHRISVAAWDRLSGSAASISTRVRIERATEEEIA